MGTSNDTIWYDEACDPNMMYAITTLGNAGSSTATGNWTTTATPFNTEPSIHLDGEAAHINFDGIKLTKEDVELMHMLLAKLKGKLAQKRASEKDLTDAIDDAVKELGG